jgi:hypothetical protein
MLRNFAGMIAALCVLTGAAHAQGTSGTASAEQEWRYILRTLRQYSDQTENNPNATVFSALILNVATAAHLNRAEAGGWASDLVRGSLLYTANDINTNYVSWSGPDDSNAVRGCTALLTRSNLGQVLLDGLLGSGPDDAAPGYFARAGETVVICQAIGKGDRHFEMHLEPYLFAYARMAVGRGTHAVGRARVRAVVREVNAVCAEHEAFLRYAVVPGFDKVEVIGSTMRRVARAKTIRNATDLRGDAILYALREAEGRGELSAEDVEEIAMSVRC